MLGAHTTATGHRVGGHSPRSDFSGQYSMNSSILHLYNNNSGLIAAPSGNKTLGMGGNKSQVAGISSHSGKSPLPGINASGMKQGNSGGNGSSLSGKLNGKTTVSAIPAIANAARLAQTSDKLSSLKPMQIHGTNITVPGLPTLSQLEISDVLSNRSGLSGLGGSLFSANIAGSLTGINIGGKQPVVAGITTNAKTASSIAGLPKTATSAGLANTLGLSNTLLGQSKVAVPTAKTNAPPVAPMTNVNVANVANVGQTQQSAIKTVQPTMQTVTTQNINVNAPTTNVTGKTNSNNPAVKL